MTRFHQIFDYSACLRLQTPEYKLGLIRYGIQILITNKFRFIIRLENIHTISDFVFILCIEYEDRIQSGSQNGYVFYEQNHITIHHLHLSFRYLFQIE